MNAEFGYLLAFSAGVFGAFHCLGMCGGIAGGFFVYHGWKRKVMPQLAYHGTRIAIYALLGISGAVMNRVLAQSGVVGKGQGIMMIVAGVVIILLGLGVAGLYSRGAGVGAHKEFPISFASGTGRGMITPVIAGMFNGLVPCSLVFSVAVKAVATADPLTAGLYMLAFGLGTLPTMAAVTTLGAVVGSKARGNYRKLAGVAVVALGVWTVYEGVVFYDIMKGLANW